MRINAENSSSLAVAICYLLLQAKEWARVMREVQALEESHDEGWVERNSKPCKGCGARIQKNGGCNHMICSKCRHQFCWVSCLPTPSALDHCLGARQWYSRDNVFRLCWVSCLPALCIGLLPSCRKVAV